MTSQAGHARIVAFWPAWTRNLVATARSLARARSRCRRCHSLLHIAPAIGAAYHVLTAAPTLLDGVIDPMCLPFRSRWHGMGPIAPCPREAT